VASQSASIVLVAASATAVANSQAPASAGPLIINGSAAVGGIATFPIARRVLVTTTGTGGQTLTINGRDRNSNPMTETVLLPTAGTVQTNQDFLTVNSAVISAASGALTVGTSGVGSTRWILIDNLREVMNASLSVNLGTATTNYTVEYTLDGVSKNQFDSAPSGNGDSSFAGLSTSTFVAPIVYPVTGLAALSVDTSIGLTLPVHALRLTVNSGAMTPGTRLVVRQQGI
jgi:hypothetical protein